jgi:hypothetical protein
MAMRRSLQLTFCLLLIASAPAGAEAWKKIEPADSALVVAIPALAGAKPTYFDRAEGQPAAPTTDKAGFAAAGTLGVFWYEYLAGPVAWRDEGLRSVVESLDWIADKSPVFSPREHPYFRGNAEGRFRTFAYRPANVDRPCVVGQYARSGAQIAERVTLIVCQPAGTEMDVTAAKKLVDGVGTKTLPPGM